MSELTKYYDPFRGAEDLRRRIDALFSDGSSHNGLHMDIDVSETPEEVVIIADLPGVQRENISLRFNSGHLEISAIRREEKKEERAGYHRAERSFGSVTRVIPVPDVDRDAIKAELEDGVLEVRMPKAEQAGAEIPITEKKAKEE